MINISIILPIIGAIMGLFIAVMVFSAVSDAVECPTEPSIKEKCESIRSALWIVVMVLPLALFFAMFAIFRWLTSVDEDEEQTVNETSKYTKQKTESILKSLLVHLGLATQVNKGR